MPVVENVEQHELSAVTGTSTSENWPHLLKLNECIRYGVVISHLGMYLTQTCTGVH